MRIYADPGINGLTRSLHDPLREMNFYVWLSGLMFVPRVAATIHIGISMTQVCGGEARCFRRRGLITRRVSG